MKKTVYVARDRSYGCKYFISEKMPGTLNNKRWKATSGLSLRLSDIEAEGLFGFKLEPGKGPIKMIMKIKFAKEQHDFYA